VTVCETVSDKESAPLPETVVVAILKCIAIYVEEDKLHVINKGVPETLALVVGCFDAAQPNEVIATQVAKIVGLLAVSSGHEVHGKVTLETMRACFSMAIVCESKEAQNEALNAMETAMGSVLKNANEAMTTTQ